MKQKQQPKCSLVLLLLYFTIISTIALIIITIRTRSDSTIVSKVVSHENDFFNTITSSVSAAAAAAATVSQQAWIKCWWWWWGNDSNNGSNKKKKNTNKKNDNNDSNHKDQSTTFPKLDDTIEMALLSSYVYALKPITNDTDACEMFNNRTYNNNITTTTTTATTNATTFPETVRRAQAMLFAGEVIETEVLDKSRNNHDAICHWYHHDWTDGTQVMIVTSIQRNYIAVVFSGTDDIQTALTDVDILMKPYGEVSQQRKQQVEPNHIPPSENDSYSINGNDYYSNNDNDVDDDDDDVDDDPRYALYNNITLSDERVRVHAGFNYGVFKNNMMGQILARVEDIVQQVFLDDKVNNTNESLEREGEVNKPVVEQNVDNCILHWFYKNCRRGKQSNSSSSSSNSSSNTNNVRVFTTGHSLGGASAVLTAVGMTIHNHNKQLKVRDQHNQQGQYKKTKLPWLSSLFPFWNPDIFLFPSFASTTTTSSSKLSTTSTIPLQVVQPTKITSITFGCPRIGNTYWKDYIHTDPVLDHGNVVTIWRIVLGWDLVPRLPEFMTHEGHTIQLQWERKQKQKQIYNGGQQQQQQTLHRLLPQNSNKKNDYDDYDNSGDNGYDGGNDDGTEPIDLPLLDDLRLSDNSSYYYSSHIDDDAHYDSMDDDAENNHQQNNDYYNDPVSLAYYEHYGNVSAGYAGVPFGWFSKPFLWIPGALVSHSICRYLKFLYTILDDDNSTSGSNSSSNSGNSSTEPPTQLVNRFVPIQENKNNTVPSQYDDDDDYWVDPPAP